MLMYRTRARSRMLNTSHVIKYGRIFSLNALFSNTIFKS